MSLRRADIWKKLWQKIETSDIIYEKHDRHFWHLGMDRWLLAVKIPIVITAEP